MAGRQAKLAAEFLVQLRGAASIPRERASVLVRAVANRVGEAVVVGNQYGPGTPVDVGNARGHWYPTLGDTEPTRDSEADQLVADPGGGLALAKIGAAVASMQLGDVLSYTNDAPYIERLNNGYSGQAPGGMTDPVVAAFDVLVQAEAARLNIGTA